MSDELKKQMEELAESAAVLCALSNNNATIARINFKDGFEAAHDFMKKDYEAKVEKLVTDTKKLNNMLVDTLVSKRDLIDQNLMKFPFDNLENMLIPVSQALAEFEDKKMNEVTQEDLIEVTT